LLRQPRLVILFGRNIKLTTVYRLHLCVYESGQWRIIHYIFVTSNRPSLHIRFSNCSNTNLLTCHFHCTSIAPMCAFTCPGGSHLLCTSLHNCCSSGHFQCKANSNSHKPAYLCLAYCTPVPCILYTCALHIVHLCLAYCTPVPCILYTCALHIVHLCLAYCTPVTCILYTCALHIVHLCLAYCTPVPCILYTCALHIVYCTPVPSHTPLLLPSQFTGVGIS
jgi:hypothetical protein